MQDKPNIIIGKYLNERWRKCGTLYLARMCNVYIIPNDVKENSSPVCLGR